jgi:RNA recognition motif-containing protein
MNTHIHVSGLSYFCTDDKLRQAFIPFGTVVLAQVVRDEWGHSLGLGIVHMSCPEDVERVFNVHQYFEVSGSRVDLWEPTEPDDPQAEREVVIHPRETRAVQTGQDAGYEESQKTLRPLAVSLRRLVQPLVSSAGSAKR